MKWIKKNIDWIALFTLGLAILSALAWFTFYASVTYAKVQTLEVSESSNEDKYTALSKVSDRLEQKVDDIGSDITVIKKCMIEKRCK